MGKKVRRVVPQEGEKVKVDRRMKRLFKKRARQYNSDDDEEEEKNLQSVGVKKIRETRDASPSQFSDDDEEGNQGFEPQDGSDDEDGGIQPGIMKFTEGINAFRLAFKKIVGKTSDMEDVLGPVLSSQKKLIAEKLGQEEAEKKFKGEAKKEKILVSERGHVKPENYVTAHEKFLLGVATKGVVKLFNAVNKAQSAQKGLNPSRSKDVKVLKKRRKEAFFSELGKRPSFPAGVSAPSGSGDGAASIWAPMRDNFMLTNPRSKDWDKIQPQGNNVHDEFGRRSDTESLDGGDD